MPQRIVREEILTSEAVNSLTWAEEVFYRRLMSKADDLGLYDARPRTLEKELYGYKDDVSREDCAQWLDACVKAGLIRTYEVDGKPYLHIEKFRQKLRRLTPKCPLPSWITRFVTDEGKVEYVWSTRDGHVEYTCSTRDYHVYAEEKRREEKGREDNKVRVGIATLHREPAAEASPAQPTHTTLSIPEEAKPLYAAWLEAVCGAHPSVRRSKTLAKDVEKAAMAAFMRCPDAMMQAALLRAYFADKRTKEDRSGEKFWRTNRQLDYFNHIEEILEHAERWDRETRWSKRAQNARRSDRNAPSCPCNGEGGQPATHEEMQAMLDDMKAELGLKGGTA